MFDVCFYSVNKSVCFTNSQAEWGEGINTNLLHHQLFARCVLLHVHLSYQSVASAEIAVAVFNAAPAELKNDGGFSKQTTPNFILAQ